MKKRKTRTNGERKMKDQTGGREMECETEIGDTEKTGRTDQTETGIGKEMKEGEKGKREKKRKKKLRKEGKKRNLLLKY